MTRRLLTTKAAAPEVGGAPAVQRIKGPVVTYGETFERWGVPLVYNQGGIALPEDLSTIKLCTQHDVDRPIGLAVEAADGAESLSMAFELPELEHTARTRTELEHRLREGLSVGVALDEDTWARIEARMWGEDASTDPIALQGELVEVSLVTVPQFGTARVEQSQEEPMTRKLITTSSEPATDAPAAPAAAPQTAGRIGTAAQTRPRSAVDELADRLLSARMSGGESAVGAILATALADITPGGNGAGNSLAGLATQAAGELSEGIYDPVYDVAVTPMTLTGMKVEGWRWSVPPTVGDYAGDKAEIPTNAATLEYASVNAKRLAGGHDLDRVYVDLGSRDVITSYWREITLDLQIKIDAKRLVAITAAAGTAGTATSITDAILQGLAAVPDASYVLIGADLWAAEGAKPESELPALLTGAGIFGDMLPTTIVNAVGVTGKVIVGRRSAVKFHLFDPPVRLEAVNIPQAGIDAGLFSYYADFIAEVGKVKQYTVTPLPLAASAASSKK